MTYRTDKNNNPIAFTTAVARDGGLVFDKDYVAGDPFLIGDITFNTAKIINDDPIGTCVRLIDQASFYTRSGGLRWSYIGLPKWLWNQLTYHDKVRIIKTMYEREMGVAFLPAFDKILNG